MTLRRASVCADVGSSCNRSRSRSRQPRPENFQKNNEEKDNEEKKQYKYISVKQHKSRSTVIGNLKERTSRGRSKTRCPSENGSARAPSFVAIEQPFERSLSRCGTARASSLIHSV